MLCKNVLKATCGLALSSMLLMACSFSAPATRSAKLNNIDSSLGYASISRMAFIGGSAVYNSDNAAASQLASGVKLPYRLGRMAKNFAPDGTAVYTSDESKAVFGYLVIDEISKSAVSFTAYSYSDDKTTLTNSSFSIALGEVCDIDNDGLADIKYTKPVYARKGQKNVRFLTFLTDEEALNTSMFSVIPDQYERGAYPMGLIGVNPDGRYIVTKYDYGTTNRAVVSGITKGDYVFDEVEGTYTKVVTDASYRSARTIDDTDLETTDGNETIDYSFNNDDWTDDDTANALLAALGEAPCATSEEATAKLNELLSSKELAASAVSASGIEVSDEALAELVSTLSALSDEEVIEVNRSFLNDYFPELCPPVAAKSTEIQDVYPLLSLDLSEMDAEDLIEESRACASVEDYDAQAKNIKAVYSKYLVKVPFIDKKIPGADAKNPSTLYAALGVGGSLKITLSNVQAGVGAVAYVDAQFRGFPDKFDAGSLFNLNKTFTIGIIPFNIGVKGDFTIGLTLGNQKCKPSELYASFSGVYGAEANVGANFGIRSEKWKKILGIWLYKLVPYFNPYANAGLVNQSASIVYIKTKDAITPVVFGTSGSIIVSPIITVTPRIGVASNTVWIGVPLKNTFDLGFNYAPKTITAFADYTLNIGVSAGLEFNGNYPTWNIWNKDLCKTRMGSWTINF